MEIKDIKLNAGDIGQNKAERYEISYRPTPDSKISMMSIVKDSRHGEIITDAAVQLSRGAIDKTKFLGLIEPVIEENSAAGIAKALHEMSNDENTVAISSRIRLVNNSKLMIDDNVITGPLSSQIMKMARERSANPDSVNVNDWMSLINFTELLFDNVDPYIREQLYDWLMYQVRNGRLTLTNEGKFLGYKGINPNLTSIHSGPGIVNGTPMNGHLDNSPGTTIEMARESVDANPNQTCSTGLHVGSFDYAKMFGSVVVLVEVDPRDVISVPYDYDGQKIRTCKYKVIKVVDDELTEFSFNEVPDYMSDEVKEDEVADELVSINLINELKEIFTQSMIENCPVRLKLDNVEIGVGYIIHMNEDLSEIYIDYEDESAIETISSGLTAELVEVESAPIYSEDKLTDYIISDEIITVIGTTDSGEYLEVTGKLEGFSRDFITVNGQTFKEVESIEVKDDNCEITEILMQSMIDDKQITFFDNLNEEYLFKVEVVAIDDETVTVKMMSGNQATYPLNQIELI